MNHKAFIYVLALLFSLTTFAQNNNVISAEKLIKVKGNTSKARELIGQAMTDSTTANNARTWFVAANIEIEYFKDEYHKLTINPNDSRVDKIAMAQSLIDAYNYYLKALPLDSVITKKGKIKTKYSKDILKNIKDLYVGQHFLWAASTFNQEKKRYPQAFNAFTIQGDIPGLQLFSKDSDISSIPDSIRGNSYFNAGISAWSGGEPLIGAKTFCKARQHKYLKQDVFSYEIACYQALAQKDTAYIDLAQKEMINTAKAGYETFGNSVPLFLHLYIRGLSMNNQADIALDLLSREIAKTPQDGILYRHRAFVYDNIHDDEKSVADYIKAAELTPDYETLIEASRKIGMVGIKKIREANNNSEPIENKRQIIDCYFNKALEFATKAKAINPNNPDLDIIIENITYNIESNNF